MDSNHDLSHILQVIQEKGNAAQKDKSNPRAQDELLTAARELVSTLESPVERLCRMVYLEVWDSHRTGFLDLCLTTRHSRLC
jgi:hypothetical protein